MKRTIQWSSMLVLALVSGCATYTDQSRDMLISAKGGSLDQALAALDAKNSGKDKEILYYLERGELLRMKGNIPASRESLMVADQKVQVWESTAKTDPARLMGNLGSVVLNDTTMAYDGRDYEKVFLSVRLALDNLAMDDWDNARVEIKKMHEREAIIADFRAKEVQAAKNKATENSLSATSFKDLNGYPVETLTDPAVNALKNSYESAFANYLAGFVYEALGEQSLAAPGYRKAAEMRPNIPLVDSALAGLDARLSPPAKVAPVPAPAPIKGPAPKKGPAPQKAAVVAAPIPAPPPVPVPPPIPTVDTLIVVETGEAPEIQSRSIPIPIPTPKGLMLTAMSWPAIMPDSGLERPQAVSVDGQSAAFAVLTESNPMARKALSDEMPGIITRSSLRAISRAVSQYAIDQSTAQMGGNAAMVGSLISLAAKVATVATEVADTRIWRSLPGYFTVVRLPLTPGVHTISVTTSLGLKQQSFVVKSGRYAVADFRLYGAGGYIVPQPEPAPALAPVAAAAPVPAAK